MVVCLACARPVEGFTVGLVNLFGGLLCSVPFLKDVLPFCNSVGCGAFIPFWFQVEQCDATSEFCELPEDSCNIADLPGSCMVVPESCPDFIDVFLPVCGCDGTTYDNDCARQKALVNKAVDGPCPETCGGPSFLECYGGTVFCDKEVGQCESANTAAGTCVQVPQECPAVFEPVCGCDNETYSNNCERL